jgi:hypothetical protein
VNQARLGPETLDDPAADEIPFLLEGLSAGLRDRLAAAGRVGPAAFYAFLPAEDADLYVGTTSRSRAQTLDGPVRFLPVDSAAELVAQWRERVSENLEGDAPETPVPIWLVELV